MSSLIARTYYIKSSNFSVDIFKILARSCAKRMRLTYNNCMSVEVKSVRLIGNFPVSARDERHKDLLSLKGYNPIAVEFYLGNGLKIVKFPLSVNALKALNEDFDEKYAKSVHDKEVEKLMGYACSVMSSSSAANFVFEDKGQWHEGYVRSWLEHGDTFTDKELFFFVNGYLTTMEGFFGVLTSCG